MVLLCVRSWGKRKRIAQTCFIYNLVRIPLLFLGQILRREVLHMVLELVSRVEMIQIEAFLVLALKLVVTIQFYDILVDPR